MGWSVCFFKGRKRRKIQWSRARRKKKGSEDEDSSQGSGEASNEEEETEAELDDSDEDYKVERGKKRRRGHRERRSSDSSTSSDDDLPPNDDPCKHCGLPNHPELVGPAALPPSLVTPMLRLMNDNNFFDFCQHISLFGYQGPINSH